MTEDYGNKQSRNEVKVPTQLGKQTPQNSTVASEQNQHCGGEARLEGPKLEGLSRGEVLGRGR